MGKQWKQCQTLFLVCFCFFFFFLIYRDKGFGIINKAEFGSFLELSCFFYDAMDVGNLISGSFAFSQFSLNIWKFSVNLC